MRNFFKLHDVGIKELLLLGLLLVSLDLIFIHRKLVMPISEKVIETVENKIPRISFIDKCGQDCQKEIDKKVSEALATVSAKKSSSDLESKVSSTTKTSYISIGSTFSTRQLGWTDVPGQVEIDKGGYGTNPSFYWDATVRIGNANGKVDTRLFDVTNGVAVALSELSSSSGSYTNVSSPALPLWNGKNTYKVQIKSTSGEEAAFASGRIKVIYK